MVWYGVFWSGDFEPIGSKESECCGANVGTWLDELVLCFGGAFTERIGWRWCSYADHGVFDDLESVR